MEDVALIRERELSVAPLFRGTIMAFSLLPNCDILPCYCALYKERAQLVFLGEDASYRFAGKAKQTSIPSESSVYLKSKS